MRQQTTPLPVFVRHSGVARISVLRRCLFLFCHSRRESASVLAVASSPPLPMFSGGSRDLQAPEFIPRRNGLQPRIVSDHCSLTTDPCSLFPVPCSLFPVLCSLFSVPCSLFPVFLSSPSTLQNPSNHHPNNHLPPKNSWHSSFPPTRIIEVGGNPSQTDRFQ